VSSPLAAAWTCCWIDTTRLFVRHPRVNGAAGAAAVEMAPLPLVRSPGQVAALADANLKAATARQHRSSGIAVTSS
jgi:hypothetical protein